MSEPRYCAAAGKWCTCKKRCEDDYDSIVPGEAKDDGTGRKSAYDTTWPDLHSGGDQ